MRATISCLTKASQLTSATAVEPTAFAAWSGSTVSYVLGQLVSVAADFANYECIEAHTSTAALAPNVSPLYWRNIGPTEADYNPATTNYALGATVKGIAGYGDLHHVYESLVLQAAAHPLPILPETETTYWADRGMTNKFAAFDMDRNTQTVYASPHVWVVTPGQRIDTIGLTGIKGNTLTVLVTSVQQGGTIYPLAYSATTTYAKNDCVTLGLATCWKSLVDGNVGNSPAENAYWTSVAGAVFDLNTRIVLDGYDYCFEPFSTREEKTILGVPPITDCIVTITLDATTAGDNVKLGSLVMGLNKYLGKLLQPTTNEGRSFSTVTRDAWGNATAVKRRNIPKLSGPVLVPSARIDKVRRARVDLDATPALYTGLDEDGDWNGMVTILGLQQKFNLRTSESSDNAILDFEAEEI